MSTISVLLLSNERLRYAPITMAAPAGYTEIILLRTVQGSGKKWRKALAEAIAPSDVDYEAYLTSLTVEYYFDEIGTLYSSFFHFRIAILNCFALATYISIVATFILFPIIRYLTSLYSFLMQSVILIGLPRRNLDIHIIEQPIS